MEKTFVDNSVVSNVERIDLAEGAIDEVCTKYHIDSVGVHFIRLPTNIQFQVLGSYEYKTDPVHILLSDSLKTKADILWVALHEACHHVQKVVLGTLGHERDFWEIFKSILNKYDLDGFATKIMESHKVYPEFPISLVYAIKDGAVWGSRAKNILRNAEEMKTSWFPGIMPDYPHPLFERDDLPTRIFPMSTPRGGRMWPLPEHFTPKEIPEMPITFLDETSSIPPFQTMPRVGGTELTGEEVIKIRELFMSDIFKTPSILELMENIAPAEKDPIIKFRVLKGRNNQKEE